MSKNKFVRQDDLIDYFNKKMEGYDNDILNSIGTGFFYSKFAREAIKYIKSLDFIEVDETEE